MSHCWLQLSLKSWRSWILEVFKITNSTCCLDLHCKENTISLQNFHFVLGNKPALTGDEINPDLWTDGLANPILESLVFEKGSCDCVVESPEHSECDCWDFVEEIQFVLVTSGEYLGRRSTRKNGRQTKLHSRAQETWGSRFFRTACKGAHTYNPRKCVHKSAPNFRVPGPQGVNLSYFFTEPRVFALSLAKLALCLFTLSSLTDGSPN